MTDPTNTDAARVMAVVHKWAERRGSPEGLAWGEDTHVLLDELLEAGGLIPMDTPLTAAGMRARAQRMFGIGLGGTGGGASPNSATAGVLGMPPMSMSEAIVPEDLEGAVADSFRDTRHLPRRRDGPMTGAPVVETRHSDATQTSWTVEVTDVEVTAPGGPALLASAAVAQVVEAQERMPIVEDGRRVGYAEGRTTYTLRGEFRPLRITDGVVGSSHNEFAVVFTAGGRRMYAHAVAVSALRAGARGTAEFLLRSLALL